MAIIDLPPSLLIAPRPEDPRLTEQVEGVDETGAVVQNRIIVEKPLTLFLNDQEIVTMMTIGDYPEYLAVGYLLNQHMLRPKDRIEDVEYDEDLRVVIVRTEAKTNFEDKLKKKTLTSGCAQGTIFGDLMENFSAIQLDPSARLNVSQMKQLLHVINRLPSLYLEAGAIHGCVLAAGADPLLYMEDVGRHNAIDKIAGYMRLHQVSAHGKIFYTTGRLTSEMVIKCVQMQIPILISRSGFTAWGVELARQAGLTLIGRAKGSRFLILAGAQRIVFDA